MKLSLNTESNSAIFTVLDQLNPDHNFIYSHNLSEAGLANYQKDNIDVIDMRLHGAQMRRLGVGKTMLVDATHYSDEDATDQSILYEKCLEPPNIEDLNGVLLEEGDIGGQC